MSVRCQNITIKDGRNYVLQNFSLTLPSGQITALYGLTGGGKTTLLLLLAGLLRPVSGEVEVNGINVLKEPTKARKQAGLGVIPEFNPLISYLTVKENLLFQARALKLKSPKKRVEELLWQYGLTAESDTLVDDLPAIKYAETGLVMALIGNPSILLLDEPENRLTSEEVHLFWEHLIALQRNGVSIVLSTRYVEVAALCHQVVILPEGKVVGRDAFTASSLDRVKETLAQ